jgi:nucleotide-binding universal stress UspA family protein
MVRFRKILVPTDFSPTSDVALDYAREIAGRFGASLHLLHVLEEQLMPGPFAFEEAKARLTRRMARREGDVAAASAQVVGGRGADTIIDYAEELGIDLIVMGTHGRTGLAHLLIGSVAERVLRSAPCPVLTVRMPVALEGVRLPESVVVAAPA